MSGDPASLLGLPVLHRELRLGTVSDVLLAGAGETVIALVVSSAWGGASHILPVGAARFETRRVETSPFALLSCVEAEYYRQRGGTLLVERDPGQGLKTPAAG